MAESIDLTKYHIIMEKTVGVVSVNMDTIVTITQQAGYVELLLATGDTLFVAESREEILRRLGEQREGGEDWKEAVLSGAWGRTRAGEKAKVVFINPNPSADHFKYVVVSSILQGGAGAFRLNWTDNVFASPDNPRSSDIIGLYREG